MFPFDADTGKLNMHNLKEYSYGQANQSKSITVAEWLTYERHARFGFIVEYSYHTSSMHDLYVNGGGAARELAGRLILAYNR